MIVSESFISHTLINSMCWNKEMSIGLKKSCECACATRSRIILFYARVSRICNEWAILQHIPTFKIIHLEWRILFIFISIFNFSHSNDDSKETWRGCIFKINESKTKKKRIFFFKFICASCVNFKSWSGIEHKKTITQANGISTGTIRILENNM